MGGDWNLKTRMTSAQVASMTPVDKDMLVVATAEQSVRACRYVKESRKEHVQEAMSHIHSTISAGVGQNASVAPVASG
jgi:hypothetical protein